MVKANPYASDDWAGDGDGYCILPDCCSPAEWYCPVCRLWFCSFHRCHLFHSLGLEALFRKRPAGPIQTEGR